MSHIFPAYRFESPDPAAARELVRLGVGGFCVYGGSAREWMELTAGLQQEAKRPLIFSADFENGAGQIVKGATEFPSNMAVAATGDPGYAELKAQVTAAESRALGVTLVFAPCVDLNTNPKNPIINVRAFSDRIDSTVEFASATIRGFRSAGVLSCLKHFPGHGDAETDSHVSLPRLTHPREILEKRELEPFVRLVGQADSVMVGHLLATAFDSKRPATISRAITGTLLRDRLGFGGLVITDALCMGGITSIPETEVLDGALQAGADVLLYPRDPLAAMNHIRPIPASLDRIEEARHRAGLYLQADPPTGLAKPEYAALAREIAEHSITLANDQAGLLPLKGPVAYRAVVDKTSSERTDRFRDTLGEIDEGSDVVVVAVFVKPRAWAERSHLTDEQDAPIRALVDAGRKVVLVSLGSPYVISELPEVSTCVCAFSDCDASQIAAARAVRGEIPFRGRLPIRLS